jgi:hypothetical protein
MDRSEYEAHHRFSGDEEVAYDAGYDDDDDYGYAGGNDDHDEY